MTTTKKRCSRCKAFRPIDHFLVEKRSRDGRAYWCRNCRAAYRSEHAQERAAYERKRRRKIGRPEQASTEQTRANQCVSRAKRAGRLVEQPCEVCGATPTHAHHDDYSKPLDVQWLCSLHHRAVHPRGNEIFQEGTTMTTAQTIAAQFGDDGQRWTDDDGCDWIDACERRPGVTIDHVDRGMAGEPVRYTFADGSVLTAAGDGWDFGYADCYCWQGAGHVEDCPEHPEYDATISASA